MRLRIHISIGILSAAIIAYQLILMQILSIVQWYHFAYMIISVALLGFGAAGTFLSIFRNRLIKRFDTLFPLLMICSAIGMALVVGLSQLPIFRFDSYLLFAPSEQVSHILKLLSTYLLFFLPFFFGALAIGLVFVYQTSQIGKLYFSNLIGSGAGGIIALILMWFFFPNELPAIIALLTLVAALLVINKRTSVLLKIFSAISFLIILYVLINPPSLVLSQFKSLSKIMNLPEAKIIAEKNSPSGLIEVVSSPASRYAPGLSLKYQPTSGKIGSSKLVFNNGNWFGALLSSSDADTNHLLNYTTNAFPYFMSERKNVLVLDTGTGKDVLQAISNNADDITAVESNNTIISLLKNKFADETDSIYYHPSVHIINITSRTYLLMNDSDKYDIIIFPMVDAFGGTSGIYAIQENYTFTKEALRGMWHRLTSDGVISITSWIDYPYRNPLKIIATIVKVLEEEGIKNPSNYITAVRGWGTVTIAMKRSPLTRIEEEKIRNFCKQMFFDPLILPSLNPDERNKYNKLQNNDFFVYVDKILSSGKEEFYDQYAFNIKPATDNSPYFSQFLKWKSIPHIAKFFGGQAIPFFEIGYLIVVLTFFQIIVISIILIILPLFKLRWKGEYRGWTLFYFSGLGLGYMLVEIIFIQRFILYFGNPIYSISAVISFMLICSGIGSYFSSKLVLTRKIFLLITGSIIAFLLIYSFILTPILQKTIAFPFILKIPVAFVLVAVPSIIMGIPFPIGLRFLNERNSTIVPWAWGINGCLSVISAVLAIILAVETGFTMVMVCAAGSYAIAFFVIFRTIPLNR
jgi:hypothetical protein